VPKIDWKNIFCPICGEKRKNTKRNKVWFDPKLSDKKKGKMVFYCTNHEPRIHIILEGWEVYDDVITVNTYVAWDKKPQ